MSSGPRKIDRFVLAYGQRSDPSRIGPLHHHLDNVADLFGIVNL